MTVVCRSVTASLAVASVMVLTGCADRFELPNPVTYAETDQVKEWSESHADPYDIPERALRAYAFAVVKTSEEGCDLGWPTVAALGSILSNHGYTHDSKLGENGVSTIPLRDLDPIRFMPVADTDQGRIDGNTEFDIPVGPMQIMPSRWEQYETVAEPGGTPNPDNIDDAALTMAKQLCVAGDLGTSEGWDAAVKNINGDPEFVKAVHARASEYSR